MAKFAFVVVDNSSGKIKHADRELIRSRCMEGVNQRQNSRRSLQAKRQNREAHISSSIGEQDAAQTDPPLADTYPHNHSRAVASGPRLDWELVRFTHSDTPVYPRELMFTSDIFVHVKSTVYPIYNHVDFDDKAVESPLRRLIYDDLFRYAVCFMVSAYKERMRQQPLSDMTNRYYRGTIALLNNKLRTGSDKQAYRDDSTIWCVSILANMALWLAQHAEVSTHTSALKQIIKICGGQAFLLQRPYLRYQLYCLELGSSLGSGTGPRLGFPDDEGYPRTFQTHQLQPQQPDEPLPSTASALLESMDGLIDERIILIFQRLQQMTLRINKQRAGGKLLDSYMFQASCESIWSQLLNLKESLQDVMSECLRLGLLAVLTTIVLRVPDDRTIRGSRAKLYPYMADRFRTACLATELTPKLGVLMFWLLAVGAMSVLDVDEEGWLVEKWRETVETVPKVKVGWEDAKECLEGVVWVEDIHDEVGRQIYTELMKKALY